MTGVGVAVTGVSVVSVKEVIVFTTGMRKGSTVNYKSKVYSNGKAIQDMHCTY